MAEGELRILVVEDDPVTRRILASALNQADFAVDAVPTIAMARRVLSAPPPDAILLDLHLPDGDGIEFARELRGMASLSAVPLVGMTGVLETEASASFEGGALFVTVLLKPVEPNVLVATLRECIGPGPARRPTGDVQVLVVDDEPLMRRLSAGHLRRAGYVVRAVAGALEAVAIASRWPPDIVVADLAMPDLPGDELARRLRALPGLEGVPVVLVTGGLQRDASPETAEAAGVNAIVAKRSDPSSLLEAVAEALAGGPRAHPAASPESEHFVRHLEQQSVTVAALREVIALQEAELSVIAGIADAIQRVSSRGELLQTTLERACDLRFVDLGVCWVRTDDGTLVLQGAAGEERPSSDILRRIGAETPLLAAALATGRLRILPDDEQSGEGLGALRQLGAIRSALLIPLRTGNEPLGLLLLGSRQGDLSTHAWALGQTIQSQLSQSLSLQSTIESLAVTARSFQAIAEALADALVTTDRDGVVVFANRVARSLWGDSDPVGARLEERLRPDDGLDASSQRWTGRLRNDRGRTREVAVHSAVLPFDSPLGRRVYTLRDVTARNRHEALLTRLATEDPLTGLPNRRAFDRAISRLVSTGARRKDRLVGVLYFDLDHFKAVNDGHGHDAGDAVLVAVADRLRRRIRNEELLARVGGDEFALLVNDTTPDELRFLGSLICRLVREEGRRHPGAVTASVGVAWGQPSKQDANALVEAADEAMFVAKRGGGDRYAEAPTVNISPVDPAS